jgi:hypothetical protein
MLFGAFCTPAYPDCILQCNIKTSHDIQGTTQTLNTLVT